jgi:hypothetical protein
MTPTLNTARNAEPTSNQPVSGAAKHVAYASESSPLSNWAKWIDRVVLAAATIIFTAIGVRYIADPVGAAAATGAILQSPLASTTTRIGFGAFPLAFAIYSASCIFSSNRLRTGVGLVATLVATAIAVRALSLIIDGAVAHSVRLFIPEGVMLALAITGMRLESIARRTRPS